jgi:hypothetical protein
MQRTILMLGMPVSGSPFAVVQTANGAHQRVRINTPDAFAWITQADGGAWAPSLQALLERHAAREASGEADRQRANMAELRRQLTAEVLIEEIERSLGWAIVESAIELVIAVDGAVRVTLKTVEEIGRDLRALAQNAANTAQTGLNIAGVLTLATLAAYAYRQLKPKNRRG